MTRHDAGMVKAFLVFVFLLLVGAVVTVYTQRVTSPAAKATSGVSDLVPTTHPQPNAPNVITSEVHSSNADKKLVLQATTTPDGTTQYVFTVSGISGGNERQLLTKTLSAGSSMSIPFNAWDPTDTYLFVEEKVGTTLTYYVLRANGEAFANGEKFIDVGGVWAAKDPGYRIRTATGWASGTLLIIYTSKDGGKGPAFWFEVPSTAIIQLSG